MSDKEEQLEEEKAIAWIKGQKNAKKNFDKQAYEQNQKEHQLEIEKENQEEFNRIMIRSLKNESRRGKKTNKES